MKLVHTADYRKLRAKEYPDIGDQLDALWKMLRTQAQADPEAKAMLDKIDAVKARFPKSA